MVRRWISLPVLGLVLALSASSLEAAGRSSTTKKKSPPSRAEKAKKDTPVKSSKGRAPSPPAPKTASKSAVATPARKRPQPAPGNNAVKAPPRPPETDPPPAEALPEPPPPVALMPSTRSVLLATAQRIEKESARKAATAQVKTPKRPSPPAAALPSFGTAEAQPLPLSQRLATTTDGAATISRLPQLRAAASAGVATLVKKLAKARVEALPEPAAAPARPAAPAPAGSVKETAQALAALATRPGATNPAELLSILREEGDRAAAAAVPMLKKGASPGSLDGVGRTHVTANKQTDLIMDQNRIVFSGEVKMSNDRFRLTSDKLVVYTKKDGQGLKFAEAQGNVMIRMLDATGADSDTSGAAQTAVYQPDTGEIILRGWPKIMQAGKTHAASIPTAEMILTTSGKLKTTGRNETIINP